MTTSDTAVTATKEPPVKPTDMRIAASLFARKLSHEHGPYAPTEAMDNINMVAREFAFKAQEIDAENKPIPERDPNEFVYHRDAHLNATDYPLLCRIDVSFDSMLKRFVLWMNREHGHKSTTDDFNRYYIHYLTDVSDEILSERMERILSCSRFLCPITDNIYPIESCHLFPYDNADHGQGYDPNIEYLQVRSPEQFNEKVKMCAHDGCEVLVFCSSHTRDVRSADRGHYCRNHHPMRSRHDNAHQFTHYHGTEHRLEFFNGGEPANIDYVGLEIEFFGSRIAAANEFTDVDPDQRRFRLENDATCDGEGLMNPHNPVAYSQGFDRTLFKLGRKLRKAGLRAWTVPDGKTYECGLHVHMNRKAFKPLHIFRLFKLMYDNLDHWHILSGRREMAYEYCNFHISDDPKERRRVMKNLGKFSSAKDANFEADRSRPLNFSRRIGTIECRIMRGSFATGHLNATAELGYSLMEFVRCPDVPLNHMSFGHYVRFVAKRVRQYPHLLQLIERRGMLGVKPVVEPINTGPYIPLIDPWWTNEMGQQVKLQLPKEWQLNDNLSCYMSFRGNDHYDFKILKRRDYVNEDREMRARCMEVPTLQSPVLKKKDMLPIDHSRLNMSSSYNQFWILTHHWNGLKPGTVLNGYEDIDDKIDMTEVAVLRTSVAGSSCTSTFMTPKLFALPIVNSAILEVKPNEIQPEQLRFEKITLFKRVYKLRDSMKKRIYTITRLRV